MFFFIPVTIPPPPLIDFSTLLFPIHSSSPSRNVNRDLQVSFNNTSIPSPHIRVSSDSQPINVDESFNIPLVGCHTNTSSTCTPYIEVY